MKLTRIVSLDIVKGDRMKYQVKICFQSRVIEGIVVEKSENQRYWLRPAYEAHAHLIAVGRAKRILTLNLNHLVSGKILTTRIPGADRGVNFSVREVLIFSRSLFAGS